MSSATWVRAALQVNPYEYHGKAAPSSAFASEEAYNTALLDECEHLGIGLIAITDHWCVASAAGLIQAATARGIVALPGFEANASEGVHLLVIFESGTPLAEVNTAISRCGGEARPGAPNGTLGAPYDAVMSAMTALGALVIPPHANNSSGLLGRLQGNPLQARLRHANLDVIGISPGVDPATDQAAILAGHKPYDREHALAKIHADDICSPTRLAADGATTWFKMGNPSLRGLKLAVRMPGTRVSVTDPSAKPRVLLREMSWTGGLLDGERVMFADDLTTFIGGRGTGKSTIIESLRYVLEIDPIADAAVSDHHGVIQGVLGSGTVITLSVEALTPHAGTYVIQRSVNDPAVVFDAAGTVTGLRPDQIVRDLEIFGQHELAEVAQDKENLARMVTRLAGQNADPEPRRTLERELADNRSALKRLERNRAKVADELSEIPSLVQMIELYEKSGWVQRLSDKTRLDKDAAAFDEAARRVEVTKADLGNAQLVAAANLVTSPLPDVDTSPRKKHLDLVGRALADLGDALLNAQHALDTSLAAASAAVAAARVEWTTATADIAQAHAETLRVLKDAGHDPDGYLSTQTRLTALRAREPELVQIDAQIQEALKERERMLGHLVISTTEEKATLNSAITAANASTGGAVLVRPTTSPDRTRLRAIVDQHVEKHRAPLKKLIDEPTFSPQAFVKAARANDLKATYASLPPSQLDAITEAGEELLRALEEVTIAAAVDVFLDLSVNGGKRDYRQLSDLSKGPACHSAPATPPGQFHDASRHRPAGGRPRQPFRLRRGREASDRAQGSASDRGEHP